MVLVGFLIYNKLNKIQFFKETFLLTNTSIEVVLNMSFLSFSNANIKLIEVKRLILRTYTIVEVIVINQKIKLISRYEFLKAALDENSETIVVHIATVKASKIAIYSF